MIKTIKAIDSHAHFGKYQGKDQFQNSLMSATVGEIAQRAKACDIDISIVSAFAALLPRGKADTIKANEKMFNIQAKLGPIRYLAVINPLQPATFKQAEALLSEPGCVGVKIHPEEHGYHINVHARAIFEFAERLQVPIVSHSGDPNSMPEDFVPWAGLFSSVNLVIAHLGCGYDGNRTHQVKAIAKAKNGNLFTDTSSAQSILPGLIEWAVKEIGADKILFGSDSPCYHTAMQKTRIDYAELSDKEKEKILRDNAFKIFKFY
jgi:hypothetical protein